jgi:integrase/recombinase XerD
MKQSREYSWSWRQAPEGPLVSYIAAFAEQLRVEGYAETSVHLYTRLVADFSKWLKEKHIPKEDISPEHTERYLRYRALHLRPRRGDVATLQRSLNLLREEGIIPQGLACTEATPTQRLLDEYAFYLRQERAKTTPYEGRPGSYRPDAALLAFLSSL